MRICVIVKRFLCQLVIISFILMTSMFDTGLILLLQGKISPRS